jgi:proteic killer suppression protein
MIKSFKDKEAGKIFNRCFSRKLPQSIQRTALLQLRSLHRSCSINDLRSPPSNHLEKLSGERRGQYSIRINDAWRICFLWREDNAHDVEIVNYH